MKTVLSAGLAAVLALGAAACSKSETAAANDTALVNVDDANITAVDELPTDEAANGSDAAAGSNLVDTPALNGAEPAGNAAG